MQIIEKEIKILEIDVEDIVDKLLKMWAVRTFSGFITDTYFYHPKLTSEQSCRIRKKNATHYITFKESLPSSAIKQCYEFETKILDYGRMLDILHTAGYRPSRIKYKMRVSYKIQDTSFDIDCYEWIPPLLEIESISENLISFWIEQLGLQQHKRKTFWSAGLFRHYGIVGFQQV